MVTRKNIAPNIIAASKVELANKFKAKLSEIDKTAASDEDFRARVLEYFKPEKPY